MTSHAAELLHGIRHNLDQFLHQLLQVLLVGFTIGMMRTVVPALAETEFGVPRNSFVLLTAFVVAFGFVKGVLNFVAGRLSERIGRKQVLLLGWLAAVPIPAMVLWAPSWNWIVAATVLLGVNQGLTWSMTQTAKLDITRADQRGLTIGLNEFSGYVGVAGAGIITGYLATALGARQGLALFGGVVIVLAIILTLLWVKDTRPWADAEAKKHAAGASGLAPRYPKNISNQPSTWEVFTLMSWRDKRLMAVSQAGLVEKFVDALVWVFYPVFLYPTRGKRQQHRLDCWRVRLRLGRRAVLHRQAVRPRRSAPTERLGHVAVRRRRGPHAHVRQRSLVVDERGLERARNGVALSQPECGGRGHRPPELARFGHWHLSLLARPGLRHWRLGNGHRGEFDRPHRERILVCGHRDVPVRVGVVVAG